MPGEVVELLTGTDGAAVVAPTATAVTEEAYEVYQGEKAIVTVKTPYYQIISRSGNLTLDLLRAGQSSHALTRQVVEVVRQARGNSTASFYSHKYPMNFIATFANEIREALIENDEDLAETPEIVKLLEILDKTKSENQGVIDARLASGQIEFEDLYFIFKKDDEVIFDFDGELISGVVAEMNIRSTWQGTYFEMKLEIIHALAKGVNKGNFNLRIGEWPGLKPITDIKIKKITPEQKQSLRDRGQDVLRFLKNGTYAAYTGAMVLPGFNGPVEASATGRVVIDTLNFLAVEPYTYRRCFEMFGIEGIDDDDNDHRAEANYTVAEDDLYRLFPWSLGFSMHAKKWGALKLSQLKDIVWREDAFDKLVMDEKRKGIIRALVTDQVGSFSDIIDGKGGGCIFLLHGPPGQGKTLTAEAVAEALHRPLYSVSIGELGIDPDSLEKNLRKILQVATIWNAVLLLDEADIFLEARDEKDIQRNAMVGVFLRLLEYHDGTLFLTTNRVRIIDSAFFSRLTLALKFEEADVSKRRSIWNNLLESAGIRSCLTDDDLQVLSGIPVNGRQIKNNIRTAMTLARYRKIEVDLPTLLEVVELTGQFQKDMAVS